MAKFKLNLFFDIVLTYLIFFALFYSWIHFYNKNIFFSFFLALIISFFIVFLLFFLKSKKENKSQNQIKQKENILESITKLMFMEKEKLLNHFFEIVSKEEETKKHKNFLETKTYLLYPFFDKSVLEADDISFVFKTCSKLKKDIIILCSSASKEALKLSSQIANIKISILDGEKTYLKYLENNAFTTDVVFSKPKKLAIKELFTYAISKERTKKYFFMGIILLISSFFVFFKIYYLVFGSILLFMALFTRLLPYFWKQKKEN